MSTVKKISLRYTILKGGGTYWQDKITDLTQLRPWEQKMKDEFTHLRMLRGFPPTCYTRFKGTEKEEFYCDKDSAREKEQDRDLFINTSVLTEAEKQLLTAAPSYDKERVFSQIKWERQKYLTKLDDTINDTHIPVVQGYPPRLSGPHVDLLYGGAGAAK